MSRRAPESLPSRSIISAAIALGLTGLPLVGAAQEPPGDEIVVHGYRSSLNASLSAKRESDGAVDVIVAEDIADFPDLNLAEALQRIPGVAISRAAIGPSSSRSASSISARTA